MENTPALNILALLITVLAASGFILGLGLLFGFAPSWAEAKFASNDVMGAVLISLPLIATWLLKGHFKGADQ